MRENNFNIRDAEASLVKTLRWRRKNRLDLDAPQGFGTTWVLRQLGEISVCHIKITHWDEGEVNGGNGGDDIWDEPDEANNVNDDPFQTRWGVGFENVLRDGNLNIPESGYPSLNLIIDFSDSRHLSLRCKMKILQSYERVKIYYPQVILKEVKSTYHLNKFLIYFIFLVLF